MVELARFADHVVVVIGGGRGIGRATALRFGADNTTISAVRERRLAVEPPAGRPLHALAAARNKLILEAPN